ncbi:MAG: J domain-containing protein [Chloroflexota bacterium]
MDLMQQLHRLQHAACPEDVFGGEETAVKATYRQLASQTHPDAHPHDPAAADEAFKLLQQWYAEAQRKIAQGCYGQPLRVKVTSANYVYEGSERPFVGDLCHLYPSYAASQPVLLKMVQHSRNNDLAQAEARVLYQLDQALRGEPLRAHFPTFVESFLLRDSGGVQRQANVLCRESDTVTLADVMAAYPDGIHPADMAWMFNRLLATLAVTHSQGLVHGAVLPPTCCCGCPTTTACCWTGATAWKSAAQLKRSARPTAVGTRRSCWQNSPLPLPATCFWQRGAWWRCWVAGWRGRSVGLCGEKRPFRVPSTLCCKAASSPPPPPPRQRLGAV